jgi:hypothetical protein
MKKLIWLSMLIGVLELAQVASAQPFSLSFVPASQVIGVGQPVTVDIFISGLGAGSPPSVGTFDLDVSFDPATLSPTGVTFGPFLGNPSDPAETITDFNFLPGVVDLAELSFLAPTELDALQPASFSLATLSFDALAKGTSPLTFSQVIVDDAFGGKLTIDPVSGQVTVPEPSSLLVFLFGLVALATIRQPLAGRCASKRLGIW